MRNHEWLHLSHDLSSNSAQHGDAEDWWLRDGAEGRVAHTRGTAGVAAGYDREARTTSTSSRR